MKRTEDLYTGAKTLRPPKHVRCREDIQFPQLYAQQYNGTTLIYMNNTTNKPSRYLYCLPSPLDPQLLFPRIWPVAWNQMKLWVLPVFARQYFVRWKEGLHISSQQSAGNNCSRCLPLYVFLWSSADPLVDRLKRSPCSSTWASSDFEQMT